MKQKSKFLQEIRYTKRAEGGVQMGKTVAIGIRFGKTLTMSMVEHFFSTKLNYKFIVMFERVAYNY